MLVTSFLAVYPDGTPAPVSDAAFKEWIWECSGNEGDGHSFEFSGNTAVYTSGSGDFMDTLITAKAKLDAGYGLSVMGGSFNNNNPQPVTDNLNSSLSLNTQNSKLNTRSVDPHIWISGENQVPISLVNEDGERIRFAPMYVPWDGTDRGFPPVAETPVPLTLQFNTHFTVENPDQLKLSFWGPANTDETEIIYEETAADSRIFSASDRQSTIEITHPQPASQGDIIAKRFKKSIPGEDKMKFRLFYSGEVIDLEVPVWMGPGYGTDETRVNMYAASNQVFNKSDCEDLNPEDYISKNTMMSFLVSDTERRDDKIIIKVKTSCEEKILECFFVSPGVYKSEVIVPVNPDFTADTVTINGIARKVLRTDSSGDESLPDISAYYQTLSGKQITLKKTAKKPALIVLALPQAKNIPIPSEMSVFFGSSSSRFWNIKENITNTIKSLNSLYCCTPCLSATTDDFDKDNPFHLKLGNYDLIFITAHGDYADIGQPLIHSWFSVFKSYSQENDTTISFYKISDIYEHDKTNHVSTLVILNCCHLGEKQNINNWFYIPPSYNNGFRTKCLVGWNGKPKILNATSFYQYFFKLIEENYNQKKKTEVKEALRLTAEKFPWMSVKTATIESAGSHELP